MGVYIKNMEMPTNCLSCPLQGGTADCRLTQKTYNWGLPERPSDCPLIHVPPHGRLIDADEFTALMFADPYQDFVHIIGQMPTIISAEEGER